MRRDKQRTRLLQARLRTGREESTLPVLGTGEKIGVIRVQLLLPNLLSLLSLGDLLRIGVDTVFGLRMSVWIGGLLHLMVALTGSRPPDERYFVMAC
jgi:hypothetical protein